MKRPPVEVSYVPTISDRALATAIRYGVAAAAVWDDTDEYVSRLTLRDGELLVPYYPRQVGDSNE